MSMIAAVTWFAERLDEDAVKSEPADVWVRRHIQALIRDGSVESERACDLLVPVLVESMVEGRVSIRSVARGLGAVGRDFILAGEEASGVSLLQLRGTKGGVSLKWERPRLQAV